MPSLPPMMQKIIADLDKKLHEPGALTNMLDTIEKKTNVKRLHVFAGFVLIYSLYLLFGHWAQLACNITGFLYPAYVSIKAIESHTKEDDTQWLTYWVYFLFNFGGFRTCFPWRLSGIPLVLGSEPFFIFG
uniref:Receptor expression-enhancing protein n=1 Tax=Meloidogyne enterolobii TaxID=390850 RepID=A0A6V7UWM5_MELEN|nr:unnamed protein product [Meloidogyne enterolobii]